MRNGFQGGGGVIRNLKEVLLLFHRHPDVAFSEKLWHGVYGHSCK